jgi:hypothetical protein
MVTLLLAALGLPACDFTVRTAGDWERVNDPDKRVICVAPGPTWTYEDVGVVQLTASGTVDAPRWLRWATDDEEAHPARVPREQTAALSQFDLRGDHWIIDGLVVRDALWQPRVIGSHNTLQRMVFEQPRAWEGRPVGLMLHFTSGTNNAVVDSVFRHPYRHRGIDSYAVYIHHAERVTVQGNEFIDLVDGVSNGPHAGGGNRIVDNEFYHTEASYTDCNGRFDPRGKCSCSEGMAFVAKGPADRPESFVERNLVWGFRRADPVCAGTGTPGVAFDFGSTAGDPPAPTLTRHFTVRDNVILAAVPNAIYLGREVEDLTFTGNYVAGAGSGMVNVYGRRVTIRDNIFGRNQRDYHTGPDARTSVYEGNRRAGSGQRCLVVRHITDPGTLCVAW